jgi:hypothetical protein
VKQQALGHKQAELEVALEDARRELQPQPPVE